MAAAAVHLPDREREPELTVVPGPEDRSLGGYIAARDPEREPVRLGDCFRGVDRLDGRVGITGVRCGDVAIDIERCRVRPDPAIDMRVDRIAAVDKGGERLVAPAADGEAGCGCRGCPHEFASTLSFAVTSIGRATAAVDLSAGAGRRRPVCMAHRTLPLMPRVS